MGRIKTKDIKKAAEDMLARYPDRFSTDFATTKQEVAQLGVKASKRVRNKLAGYITRHKKIQARGPRTFSPSRYAQGHGENRS